MLKPITIVGGGLAGLTLGIGLRRRGVPVTIWEAGCYPRHRVCGEFVSGRGEASLARLGLLDALQKSGARRAVSVAFFSGTRSVPPRPLPSPALSISRFTLDELLATAFQRAGGNLQCGVRWNAGYGSGVVRASGRRIQSGTSGWRLFGLKVHASLVELTADLEMHFTPSGYVGVSRLPGNEVNICGLFRSKAAVRDLSVRWQDWLSGPPGSALRSRLAAARFDRSSFCSVAGISTRPMQAANLEECCIGDAVSMIPPVTGNGMSMAFESAEMAVEPLAAFSHGAASWREVRRQIAHSLDAAFTSRLRNAAFLQCALFSPILRTALLRTLRSNWLWRELFRLTR